MKQMVSIIVAAFNTAWAIGTAMVAASLG